MHLQVNTRTPTAIARTDSSGVKHEQHLLIFSKKQLKALS